MRLASALAPCLLLASTAASALGQDELRNLATADVAGKLEQISVIVARGDEADAPALRALLEGRLWTIGDQVLIDDGVAQIPAEAEKVSINNRVRRSLERGLAALGLFAKDAPRDSSLPATPAPRWPRPRWCSELCRAWIDRRWRRFSPPPRVGRPFSSM